MAMQLPLLGAAVAYCVSTQAVKQREGQSFDAGAHLWRHTEKFLTFKPVAMSIAWTSVDLYTGSASTMPVFGGALTLSTTAAFFVNNFAWDYYDFHSRMPQNLSAHTSQSSYIPAAPFVGSRSIMPKRLALPAAIVATFLTMVPALGQTASTPSARAADDASLSHSAMKATTFKVGTVSANLVILSFAAGGVVGGTALAIFNTAASWMVYTVNDYAWDTYSPPPVKQDINQAFDASSDVWRTTGKFLTYKPVAAAIKFGSIYAYTGSVTTMLVFGPVSSLANTAVFYVNNVAWDFYDWYVAAPQPVAAMKP